MSVTIRDIAKEANVSITTVSRVINGDYSSVGDQTRQRVEEIVEKHHYTSNKARWKPNQNAIRERIAIIVPDLQQPFFNSLVTEFEKCCAQKGFSLQLCNSRNDIEIERKHVKNIIDDQVKGLLYMSTATTTDNCFEELKKSKLPFVDLDSNLNEYCVPGAVFVNGENGIFQATEHLIQNGHREIAYISGIGHLRFNNVRYQGYVRALLENNLAVDPQMTIFGSFTFQSGIECTQKLLWSKKKFTAIVCENDLIAIGAMHCLTKNGLKIPDDVSLIGFDDIEMDQMMTPKLTSVTQHTDQIIEKAMDLLLRLAQGEHLEDPIVQVMPDLVVRDSVKKLNR